MDDASLQLRTPPLSHPTDADALVRAFFEGRNERTTQAYRADLEDFSRDLLQRHLSAATVNRRLSAIRSLLKLAKSLGFVTWEVIAKNAPVVPYRDTKGPTLPSVRRLFAVVAKRPDRKGVRDFALIRVMYNLALRRNEAVTLDLSHVEIERGVLQVLRKGRTDRQPMTLAKPTAEALRQWISLRGPESGPLFLNCDRAGKGERLTGVSVNRIVAKWGTKIGLRLTAHQLRHAAITHALDATNGDVRAVARFSGHRQLQTLVVYDDNRIDLGAEISRIIASSADPAMSI